MSVLYKLQLIFNMGLNYNFTSPVESNYEPQLRALTLTS